MCGVGGGGRGVREGFFVCLGGEGVVGIVNEQVLPYQFMH